MNNNIIDIIEEDMLSIFGEDVLECLLCEHAYDLDEKERSKRHHIYWATDNYEHEGAGFGFFDEIKIENVTGIHYRLVRPRAAKTKDEQVKRTRDKAEVFTPSWVCNAQNNIVDEAWFGRKDVFNTEVINSDGMHDWLPTEGKIVFPDGKTWQSYVLDIRLEMACGEAPYLVSRYDTTTGELINELPKRIGVLDRKLRVVGENVETVEDWYKWAFVALKSTFGFEWQGDNLLLARESILFSFIDYYKDFTTNKHNKTLQPNCSYLKHAAMIISWNIFQMDGIKMILPRTDCSERNDNGIYQHVAVWDTKDLDLYEQPAEIIEFRETIQKHKKNSVRVRFNAIVANPPYQEDDGGHGPSSRPLYNKFVDVARSLAPDYITMIMPARWYAGGKGGDLVNFRFSMANDPHLQQIDDFRAARECFDNVEIKGGVCYFLWNKCYNAKQTTFVSHRNGKVESTALRDLIISGTETIIRFNEAITVLQKVQNKNFTSFSTIVNPRKPFGLASNFRDYVRDKDGRHTVEIFAQKDKGFADPSVILRNKEWKDLYKVYIPEAIGKGDMTSDKLKPILGLPNTICSETYILIGPFDTKKEAENVVKYIRTKFFHFMLGLKKNSQHTTQKEYVFVPLLDFASSSQINWNVQSYEELDSQLFKYYDLSESEACFINNAIPDL